jgi:hypothetical protein
MIRDIAHCQAKTNRDTHRDTGLAHLRGNLASDSVPTWTQLDICQLFSPRLLAPSPNAGIGHWWGFGHMHVPACLGTCENPTQPAYRAAGPGRSEPAHQGRGG